MADNRVDREVQDHVHSIPERRQGLEKWAAIASVCLSALLLWIVDVFVEVGYPNELQTNRDNRCKKRSQTGLVSTVSTVASLCLSAVFGTMVDRLCLVNEERNHLATRYERSWRKMIASCFSGIRWSFVIAVVCLALSLLAMQSPARREIFTTLLGSLLIVPLIRLFTSNTQSHVEVSRILEDNAKSVGNGLAWSYYFGYLEIILPDIKERVAERNWPGFEMSSGKLFILLPLDCNIRRKIKEAHANITEVKDGDLELMRTRGALNRKYTNKAHCIRHGRETYHVLLEYASTLDTLRNMRNIGRLEEAEMIEQVKLFCQTLRVDILDNPLKIDCQGKYELVIYDPKLLEEQERTLAGVLAERIERIKDNERRERGAAGMARDAVEDEEAVGQQERGVQEYEVTRVVSEQKDLQELQLPTKETRKPDDTTSH